MEASQILTAVTAVLALAEGQKRSDLAVPNGEPPPLCHHLKAKGVCGACQGCRRPLGSRGDPELSAPAAAGRLCCLPSWGQSSQAAEERGTGTAAAAGWRREGPRTGSDESRKLHNGSLLRPQGLGKESDF